MPLRLLSYLYLAVAARCSDVLSSERRGHRYVKLPVVHSTNPQVFAKVYDDEHIATIPLAKRADVAYYAKCLFLPKPTSRTRHDVADSC